MAKFRHPFWNNLNIEVGYTFKQHLNDGSEEIRRLAGVDMETPINTVIRADKKCKVEMLRIYPDAYRNFIRLQYNDHFVELGHILKPKVKEGFILQPGMEIARTGAYNRWLHIAWLVGKNKATATRVNPVPYLKAFSNVKPDTKPPQDEPTPVPTPEKPVEVVVEPPTGIENAENSNNLPEAYQDTKKASFQVFGH